MVKDYSERRKDFKHASITLVKAEQATLLVTATATYIPIDQFKSIFNEITHWAEHFRIRKLIFLTSVN